MRSEGKGHAERVAAPDRGAPGPVLDLARALQHHPDPVSGGNIARSVRSEVHAGGAKEFGELVADERRFAFALQVDAADEAGDELLTRVAVSIDGIDRRLPPEAEVRRVATTIQASVLPKTEPSFRRAKSRVGWQCIGRRTEVSSSFTSRPVVAP